MKFDELHAMIPYAKGGKEKILRMKPYDTVTLALPGRHWEDTDPIGGDFVVMVDDEKKKWKNHQFTHIDLFEDLEDKTKQGTYQDLMQVDAQELAQEFMRAYLKVIQGEDPNRVCYTKFDYLSGIRASTFLRAAQSLAVAEHRRYAKYEAKFGGRFLPFRFGAGIVEGLWTAVGAADKQKRGRPGVEWLEKDFGLPQLTKELMA